ncbi:uncharacterized protein Z518_04821 [Rhinocladiella mackenziei CBS 650.93]|uniref:S-adenosyl-L-methionine-dependent methyltransferase n=1 Tax=Rhinocladiella mackenziei CBS 650.93 TaxID=1442369 RepID=A0A0D2JCK2_9EURO|nr:uncharacterized protein Z518_04821 [Rhinocladiella mackenziei CBS 650.93]KIX06845.1 hypothetical protein Z518_04821 [Rhinocladiella mackenziei CBS 650.93]
MWLTKAQSTTSYCTSIESEIRNGRIENGRVYAAYGKNEYGLPVDEYELDRIDMNHAKYTLLQGNKLFLAPLPLDPQRILDIGTGTGIFAIDVAEMFPSAIVTGTDISPMQPPWVPPNCSFEIDDAEADWVYPRGLFDYVHARDLYHSIRDWPRLIGQAYTHLRPGGYLELACVWPVPKSDDGTLPREGSAYVKVCDTFQEIAEKIGAAPDAPLNYRSWMIDAGFKNVREHIFKIPTSPWPRDPRLKKIGALELMNVMEGAQAFLLRGYTTNLGRTREELELLLTRMRKELVNQRFHSYVSFIVVYGQKPHV